MKDFLVFFVYVLAIALMALTASLVFPESSLAQQLIVSALGILVGNGVFVIATDIRENN